MVVWLYFSVPIAIFKMYSKYYQIKPKLIGTLDKSDISGNILIKIYVLRRGGGKKVTDLPKEN